MYHFLPPRVYTTAVGKEFAKELQPSRTCQMDCLDVLTPMSKLHIDSPNTYQQYLVPYSTLDFD